MTGVKTVEVIGGAGFIGTRLCSLLSRNGLSYRVFDKRPLSSFGENAKIGDIRNSADLTTWLEENSVVINLAAEHKDDVRPVSLYDEVNVQGARNLCDACREKNINTIIFTSSVAVYGFAPVNTDESGEIDPFNDYGRTKAEAEEVYMAWCAEDPENRTLVIIRPTVVFGEQNRGNVYNFLKQIASGRFLMIGNGLNCKSMAYVENVSAFIVHSLGFAPGVHVYNYIDKPDLSMNVLVSKVRSILGRKQGVGLRIPYWIGFSVAKILDFLAFASRRSFSISSIRVKKFCSDTVFDTSVEKTGFVAPVPLEDALLRTVKHEFTEDHSEERLFYSE